MAKTFLPIIFLFCYAIAAAQNRYDVIITEIMPDPTPQVGLPNSEWVELKNVSPATVNLQGFRLGDATGLSGPVPFYELAPGAYVVVSTSGAVAALSAFGPAISVTSFPSLDNNGETIYLQDANGNILHAVEYSAAWHDNEVKRDGGYTLEMIDTGNPCTAAGNWKSSNDATGGTPGKKNSVDGTHTDDAPPQLLHSYVGGTSTIVLVFDEPLNEVSATLLANYSISPAVNITAAVPQPPLFRTVKLTTALALQQNTSYTITVSNITDCSGNLVGARNNVRTGISSDAAAGDIVINEILFNPNPGGDDFVELYNRSEKILDASRLLIANRNSGGDISSLKKLSETPYLIFPGDYLVLSPDPAVLATQYLVKEPQQVLSLSLPTYPNDKGFVVLTNAQGDVVDEVDYDEKWHFALVSNKQGVSLERISVNTSSQDAGNWTSAASTSGFATPTYKNSQSSLTTAVAGDVSVVPKVFSPDNDGFDDFAQIHYGVDATGYLANVIIFDAAGRPVRHLVRNAVLGREGQWTWDGLGDKNERLPVGTYAVYTEIFTTDGKRRQYKNAVILARKMN